MSSGAAKSEQLLKLLNQKLSNQLLEAKLDLGDVVVRLRPEGLLDFVRLIKLDRELAMNVLVSITAVDWLDRQEERFEMVYHLASLANQFRLRIKVWIPESKPEIASLVSLWSGANFLEREVWDMYGIKFSGHPDLRRILMYDEFKGHPLRKDYPVQGKQPRVALRYPEVENTARLMQRPELVQIGRKSPQFQTSHGSAK